MFVDGGWRSGSDGGGLAPAAVAMKQRRWRGTGAVVLAQGDENSAELGLGFEWCCVLESVRVRLVLNTRIGVCNRVQVAGLKNGVVLVCPECWTRGLCMCNR